MFQLLTTGTGAATLRDMLVDASSGGVDFVGTPDSVAARVEDAMQEIGDDGFTMTEALTRRGISEITDGLAPTRKQRGLIRSSYSHMLFRDNLLALLGYTSGMSQKTDGLAGPCRHGQSRAELPTFCP